MNSHQKKQLIGALLAILFIAAIVSIFYTVFGSTSINDLTLQTFFYHLAQFLGLTGFFFISLLIISGDFARLFDSVFGIDRIIKTQRKFSIFTYFIVFSHPLLIILSQNSYVRYLIPNFALLPFAAGTFALYIFAGIMISSLLYKRVSYRAWQYLHIFTYVLFTLVFYHSLNFGSHMGNLSMKIIFYTLAVLVFIGLVYRTNYKLKQRKNKFYVKDIRQETHDTFTLVIESKNAVNFKPGQFFFLRLDGRKLYARHPFSVSSSPSEKNLSFTMKNTGRFTKEAKNLKPGDEIKIEGSYGKFVVQDDEKKDLVFIAGGVGITPFMSIIKDNLNKSDKKNITLLYGSKTEKEIIFKRELDSINGNFRKVYILSEEENNNYDYGRISEEIITKYIKDVKSKKFYICGPKPMMDILKITLKKLGVNKKDIVIEDFFW